MIAQVPMGRIGRPEECAEAILWLMSGEAAYMVGAVEIRRDDRGAIKQRLALNLVGFLFVR